jgi:class 3 adenylate cyclase
MIEQKKNELMKITRNRIEIARKHLNGKNIEPFGKKFSSLEAELPGYIDKPMKYGEFANSEYIVLMTDIRKSTDIINQPDGVGKMLQIYYAYSALVANIADSYGGTATEFLGDGLICLFDTKATVLNTLPKALNAAKDILLAREKILLPVLREYKLPEISFGIGLDFGATIVTRFGFKGDSDLKAFGKCVYNVARLCKGKNEIKVSLGCFNNQGARSFRFQLDTDSKGGTAYRLL